MDHSPLRASTPVRAMPPEEKYIGTPEERRQRALTQPPENPTLEEYCPTIPEEFMLLIGTPQNTYDLNNPYIGRRRLRDPLKRDHFPKFNRPPPGYYKMEMDPRYCK